jgi:hypothetical protein
MLNHPTQQTVWAAEGPRPIVFKTSEAFATSKRISVLTVTNRKPSWIIFSA